MSDPITLAQSRAPPSPATATPPLPIAVAKENGSSNAADGAGGGTPHLARSSGSLQVRGRSPTPSSRNGPDSEYGSVCGSLRGSSVRGSSPVVGGSGGGNEEKPSAVRGTSPPPPVAPYQALPVRGPVNLITHNMTEGLPVVEPGETDPKELDARMTKVISDYTAQLTERTEHHMGYPYNLDFDSYKALEGLSRFCINNLGDPFIESNYGVHSRAFEIGVLEWFARLWEAPSEEEGGYWGYITNCGTEGNLHGILVGRENLPDAVLYASAETHYSVFKAARMYRMDAERVATLPSGEIDVEDLAAALARNRGRPAVVVVNVGTTVRGAVDDLDAVLLELSKAGLSEDQFFIHCDGALFGLMMPFVRAAAPLVTFKKPIGSISVSGHKFIGAPMPCGVVMTRAKCVEALSSDVEYLNSRDATIMGSRNGHAPIYMWYTLTRKGYVGMRADVEHCLANAHLLQEMLESNGIKTMLNRLSSTVVFERPPCEAFVRKWQLACEGDVAHVVVMPNITPPKLEAFVKDLVECREKFFNKNKNKNEDEEAAKDCCNGNGSANGTANGSAAGAAANGAAEALGKVSLGSNGTAAS